MIEILSLLSSILHNLNSKETELREKARLVIITKLNHLILGFIFTWNFYFVLEVKFLLKWHLK